MVHLTPSHASGLNVGHAGLHCHLTNFGGTVFHSCVFEVAVVASRLNIKPLEVSSVAENVFFTLHGGCDPASTADGRWQLDLRQGAKPRVQQQRPLVVGTPLLR